MPLQSPACVLTGMHSTRRRPPPKLRGGGGLCAVKSAAQYPQHGWPHTACGLCAPARQCNMRRPACTSRSQNPRPARRRGPGLVHQCRRPSPSPSHPRRASAQTPRTTGGGPEWARRGLGADAPHLRPVAGQRAGAPAVVCCERHRGESCMHACMRPRRRPPVLPLPPPTCLNRGAGAHAWHCGSLAIWAEGRSPHPNARAMRCGSLRWRPLSACVYVHACGVCRCAPQRCLTAAQGRVRSLRHSSPCTPTGVFASVGA